MTLVRCVSGEAPEDSDLGRADAFPGGVSDGRLRDRDAFSLLPRHCWEDVASLCDTRSLARLAATCAGLAGVVRSTTVRTRGAARCLGNRPRARLIFAKVASARPRVVSGAAPPPPLSPAAAEELGARRGWAATCASAIAADAWIPRGIDADPAEEDGSEDEGSDPRRGGTTPRSTRTTPTSRGSETRDRREPSRPSMTTRRRGIAT